MANPVPIVDDRYLAALTDRWVYFDGVSLAIGRPAPELLRIVAAFGMSVVVDIVAAFAVAVADDGKPAAEDWLAVAAWHIVVHLRILLVFSNSH